MRSLSLLGLRSLFLAPRLTLWGPLPSSRVASTKRRSGLFSPSAALLKHPFAPLRRSWADSWADGLFAAVAPLQTRRPLLPLFATSWAARIATAIFSSRGFGLPLRPALTQPQRELQTTRLFLEAGFFFPETALWGLKAQQQRRLPVAHGTREASLRPHRAFRLMRLRGRTGQAPLTPSSALTPLTSHLAPLDGLKGDIKPLPYSLAKGPSSRILPMKYYLAQYSLLKMWRRRRPQAWGRPRAWSLPLAKVKGLAYFRAGLATKGRHLTSGFQGFWEPSGLGTPRPYWRARSKFFQQRGRFMPYAAPLLPEQDRAVNSPTRPISIGNERRHPLAKRQLLSRVAREMAPLAGRGRPLYRRWEPLQSLDWIKRGRKRTSSMYTAFFAHGGASPHPAKPLSGPMPLFKWAPGYLTAWRKHRQALARNLGLPALRQEQVTKFIAQLHKTQGLGLWRTLALTAGALLNAAFGGWGDHAYLWLFKTKGVRLNSRPLANPFAPIAPGDVLSWRFEPRHPVGPKFVTQPPRLRTRCHALMREVDVPSYVEVDFLSRALTVLYWPTQAGAFDMGGAMLLPHASFRLYNWKIIT